MNKNAMQFSYQVRKEKQRKTFIIILFALALFTVVNLLINYVVFPVKQTSVSMIPDIPENSVIMVSPVSNKYQRGDVVLLRERKTTSASNSVKISDLIVSFFTAQRLKLSVNKDFPGTSMNLRRIVGMPGDTFYMRDYVLYVKPEGEKHFLTEFEITDISYDVTFYIAPNNWDSSLGVKGSFDEITLKEDEYFVLADNRKSSDDSRLWGIINSKDIKAKALFCYFPFNKIKFF